MPLPHSTASCFTAYLLPHVLFVADAEERRRIARVCCLAWNIALFPQACEREQHLEGTVELILRDAMGDPCPPPPGFRQGFADELRWLVEAKRDLFPWQLANVTDIRDDLDSHGDGWQQPELGLSPVRPDRRARGRLPIEGDWPYRRLQVTISILI